MCVCLHVGGVDEVAVVATLQSTHKDRQTRCQRILTEAKRSNSGLENLIVVSLIANIVLSVLLFIVCICAVVYQGHDETHGAPPECLKQEGGCSQASSGG